MKLRLAVLLLLVFFLPCLPAGARERDVDSAERLRYLEGATGASPLTSSSDTFQARLDAVMNVNATSENTLVSADDENMRQARIAAALQSSLNTTTVLAEKRKDDTRGRLRTRIDEFRGKSSEALPEDENQGRQKVKIDRYQDPGRVDASEESYRQSLEDLQAEQDEAREQILKKRKLGLPDDETPAPPVVSRALSNNPFYFQSVNTEIKRFDEAKTVILSRLIERGYERPHAEGILEQASNPEELVLVLMEQEDYTYGEASDVASV